MSIDSRHSDSNSAHHLGDSAPRRRSIRERLDEAGQIGYLSGTGGSSHLTETHITAVGGLEALDMAYGVDHTGQVSRVDGQPAIVTNLVVSEPAAVIGMDDVRDHHVLLLPEEVDAAELEALAVSIWDDAGWVGAGELRLTSSAHLRGPWMVDATVRKEMKTSAHLTRAWVIHCPQVRSAPPNPALQAVDDMAAAFPEGMPTGLEYRVLHALMRMTRRLAGAVRFAGSGHVVEPDPDSAVSLAVYSPRWLAPEQLLEALRVDFPSASDTHDAQAPVNSGAYGFVGRTSRNAAHAARPAATGRASVRNSARQEKTIEELRAQLGPVREDITHKIANMRRQMDSNSRSEGLHAVNGYAVIAPVGNRSDMMVEVSAVPTPPRVLRWEPWTSSTIIEYQIRWLPGGTTTVPVGGLSRSARLERMRSTQDIEKAAGIVVSLVGGSVIDEDGFLVGLERRD